MGYGNVRFETKNDDNNDYEFLNNDQQISAQDGINKAAINKTHDVSDNVSYSSYLQVS